MFLTKILHPILLGVSAFAIDTATAQDPAVRLGGEIPAEVDAIYDNDHRWIFQ